MDLTRETPLRQVIYWTKANIPQSLLSKNLHPTFYLVRYGTCLPTNRYSQLWPLLQMLSSIITLKVPYFTFKRQCDEIFCFRVFYVSSSPNLLICLSNLFKKSLRCSKFKMHPCQWHCWQMEKIFKGKKFFHIFLKDNNDKQFLFIDIILTWSLSLNWMVI